MAFVGKKVYGQSKQDSCAFCGDSARVENSQGFLTCNGCKEKVMGDIKCMCGNYLEVKKSKWGAFFTCTSCGAISLKKAMELKDAKVEQGVTRDGFKLNKKFQPKPPKVKYEKDRIYTMGELEDMWD
jgi:hypothetical protein